MPDNEKWSFFESLDEMVYVTDMETNELVYMNRHLRNALEYRTHEEYRGRKCYENRVEKRHSYRCMGREAQQGQQRHHKHRTSGSRCGTDSSGDQSEKYEYRYRGRSAPA